MLDFLFTRSRGAGLHGAGLREILDRSGVGRQPVATGKSGMQHHSGKTGEGSERLVQGVEGRKGLVGESPKSPWGCVK